MLNRSQVNFSGVGAATVVVCGERRIDQADPTKRILTAQDVSFVDHDDPVYEIFMPMDPPSQRLLRMSHVSRIADV